MMTSGEVSSQEGLPDASEGAGAGIAAGISRLIQRADARLQRSSARTLIGLSGR
jgi:hypothetical protein